MTLWFCHQNLHGYRKDITRINLDRNPCPTIMAGGVNGDNISHYWLEDDGRGMYEVKVRVIHQEGKGSERSLGDITDRPCNTITVGSPGAPSSNYWKVEYYLSEKLPEMPQVKYYGPIALSSNSSFEQCWISADNPSPTILTTPTDKGGGLVEVGYYEEEKMQAKVEKPPYRVPSMQEIAALPPNGYKVVSSFSGCGGSCLGYRMAGYKVLWANEFIPAAQETYKANHPHSILDTRDIRKVQPEEILYAIGLKQGEIDIFDGSPPCASFSTAGKREKAWGKVKDYSDTKQRVDDLFFEYTRLLKGLQPKVFVAENVSGLVKGTAKGYFLEILKALKDCGYTVSAKLLDAQWLGVPQMRQRIIFIGVRNDLVAKYGVKPVHPDPLSYRYTVREALLWIVNIRHGNGFGEEEWISASQTLAQTVGSSPSSGNNLYGNAHKIEAIPIRAIHDTGGQVRFSAGDITDVPSPTVTAQQQWYIEEQVIESESDISKYAVGALWDDIKPGESHRKRFNLTKPHLDAPCPTVVQCGGHPNTASVVHPLEKRKFSIAELKRICAFPDDFILCGSFAQQWERLGRAVPPVMMSWVAKTIQKEILEKIK